MANAQTGTPRRPLTELSMTIAVLTYRRPADLAELLPQLGAQVDRTGLDVEILVVDNDPAGSGRSGCVGSADPGASAVRYVLERRPGIAAARNRALRETSDRDVLIFIDDDERPSPQWLESLLGTFGRTAGVGVVGSIVCSFGEPLDPWIEAGGFFRRRRLPTGTELTIAASSNLLLDLHEVRRSGVRFDDRFGLSGGSDTLFTRQLTAAGGRLVWCDEAEVTDVVPADRATRGWVLRRRLRSGNSDSRIELAMAGSVAARLRVRIVLAGRGIARITGGVARIALGLLTRSVRHQAAGAGILARGLGIAGGAVGYTYVEYRRPRAARRAG